MHSSISVNILWYSFASTITEPLLLQVVTFFIPVTLVLERSVAVFGLHSLVDTATVFGKMSENSPFPAA